MNIQTLLSALQLGEDKDWEFKSAKGGLPASLWESYSAMANTDGGVIVLGVKERDGERFEVQGLDDPVRMEKDFWSTVNNRGKVSANLLSNRDVGLETIDGKRMFQMMGAGDKASSGIDKIRQGWESQKWRWPLIEEHQQPDRVRLILPMVSLLPEESLDRLRSFLGENLGGLNVREVQALVTADMEGSVTNQRLQQFSSDHTTDITKMLQELIVKGLLLKDGYGRWASYRLADRLARSGYGDEVTPDTTSASSLRKETRSQHNDPSSQHSGPVLGDPELLAIAAPARDKARLAPATMTDLIRELCQSRYLTVDQIGALLHRHPEGIRNRFLSKMVRDGQLSSRYPDPTHPDQAYRTNPDWKGS